MPSILTVIIRELKQDLIELYSWLVQLYTLSELKLMAIGSAVGAVFSGLVGGADQQVLALVYLVAIDYLTGIGAGWRAGQIQSTKGFKGIIKKVLVFVAVGFANLVDQAMAIHTLRSMAIFGFAAVEATSIIENIDRLGYGRYIPEWLRNKLMQIRAEKGVRL